MRWRSTASTPSRASLAATCREGDVVLAMSNGDFGGLWEKLLEALGRS
jgi:aspartate aminotransferase-like enzyme